jgi:hypothetical protein
VLPVIIFALVAIPLLIVAVAVAKKRTAAGEPAPGDTAGQAEIEREFDEAERYQEAWREQQHPHHGNGSPH